MNDNIGGQSEDYKEPSNSLEESLREMMAEDGPDYSLLTEKRQLEALDSRLDEMEDLAMELNGTLISVI